MSNANAQKTLAILQKERDAALKKSAEKTQADWDREAQAVNVLQATLRQFGLLTSASTASLLQSVHNGKSSTRRPSR